MAAEPALARRLTGYILDELFMALGFKAGGWPRQVFWPPFWLPARRFARLAADFDQWVARAGFRAAARGLLPHFTDRWEARGEEHIPPHGPLLVASNHPGAFDALVIAASLPRDDLKIIVSGVPFIRGLEALKNHFIYSTVDMHVRMNALRAGLRHLQGGGALLLFASGLVDPDPAFLPGAQAALERWSDSLKIFLRQVPELQVTVSIVSGVLSPACMHNPLIQMRKMTAWQRQRIAEYIQIMQQLTLGRKFGLIPRASFSQPVPAERLYNPASPGRAEWPAARQRVLGLAQETLTEHLTWIRPDPGDSNP